MNPSDSFFSDPHRLLKDAAAFLGVSITTLRREKRRGKLKVFEMGGSDCVLDSEIHAYRERKIKESQQEAGDVSH